MPRVTWQLGSTLLVRLALAAGLAWYERSRPPSKLVALVAALAALAVAGRVLFAPIPNVQATTDVVLLSGYALGPLPGFVSAPSARWPPTSSSGRGPGRPGRCSAGAMAGVGGAALAAVSRPAARAAGRSRSPARLPGFAFGAWMDLFTLVVTFAAEQLDRRAICAIAGVSLPFNVAHAVGNAVLCLALRPGVRAHAGALPLPAARSRWRVSRAARWQPGTAGVALAALVLAGAVAGPVRAADPSRVRYLERAQNADGGFGGAPRRSPRTSCSRAGPCSASRRRAATRWTYAGTARRRSTTCARGRSRS